MGWHASEADLALVRTGDLPRWKQYFVRRHLRRCAACEQVADSYLDLAQDLSELGQQRLEPPAWLAARIVAGGQEASAARMSVGAITVRAAAMLALVVLALLLVAQRSPLPPHLNYEASASADAVVEESAGPFGRQRVVFYTGTRGGQVDVSASTGGISVSHADPATGAMIITTIAVKE